MIPEHLLEEAAVRYLIDIGQNPLHFTNEIGLQPIRIRKIMSSYMMKSAPPQVVEAVKPQGRKQLLVNSASSTWKTKTIAGIALLASMGIGAATIARMIKRPEQEVKQVIELNKDKIERLQAVGRERRDEPTQYPLRDRQQVAETQEHLWFTRILFAEAANQPLRGKEAVAQVVINRSRSGRYPNSIIGVIVQARQFSGYNGRLWRMSEHPDEMNAINRRAYLQCSDVATRAIAGQLPNHVGGATLYHDTSLLECPWNKYRVRLVSEIGAFKFYEEIR